MCRSTAAANRWTVRPNKNKSIGSHVPASCHHLPADNCAKRPFRRGRASLPSSVRSWERAVSALTTVADCLVFLWCSVKSFNMVHAKSFVPPPPPRIPVRSQNPFPDPRWVHWSVVCVFIRSFFFGLFSFGFFVFFVWWGWGGCRKYAVVLAWCHRNTSKQKHDVNHSWAIMKRPLFKKKIFTGSKHSNVFQENGSDVKQALVTAPWAN